MSDDRLAWRLISLAAIAVALGLMVPACPSGECNPDPACYDESEMGDGL